MAKSKPKPSRLPSTLVDIADAREIELEDGIRLKFPLSGRFALCSSKNGQELWIVSRKGSRKVAAEDKDGAKLFERFTGFEAQDTGSVVRSPKVSMQRIGRAVSIVYRSDKWEGKNHDYIHLFKTPPTVSVDKKNRPSIVALRGGKIRVKAEGITG